MEPSISELLTEIPMYLKLKFQLKELIDKNILKTGDQLPIEDRLIEEYGMSRSTVRRALSELEREGLIYRKQRRGTFVRSTPFIQEETKVRCFTHEIQMRGLTPGSRVVELKKKKPDSKIKEILHLDKDEDAIFLCRVRTVNGEPVSVSRMWMPYNLCAGVLAENMEDKSLWEVWERKLGIELGYASEIVKSSRVSAEDAKKLRLKPSAPILEIERTIFQTNGKPLSHEIIIAHGEKFNLRITLPVEREKLPGLWNLNKKDSHAVVCPGGKKLLKEK